MATVADITHYLEEIAPRSLQESYDNARLICGTPTMEVKGILVSLDAIESVVEEAIATGANLIVSHHPIVFSGLKSLTGANYIERTVIKAIQHDIALYAMHTNLDNVLVEGVNETLANRIGLNKLSILQPKTQCSDYHLHVSDLLKTELLNELQTQLASQLSRFGVEIDTQHEGIHVTGPDHLSWRISQAADRYKVKVSQHSVRTNQPAAIGAGIIGHLPMPITETEFLLLLKEKLNLTLIKHTALRNKSVERVALCGGSGSFLLKAAKQRGADVFVTADYKYHQFFDAEGEIVIADVGHYESEQFTIDLLVDLINRKFSNFAARCAKAQTNPVKYFI